MGGVTDVPLNSRQGMETLFKWAKAHGIVLNEAHEKAAKRYGVDTSGVIISRPI